MTKAAAKKAVAPAPVAKAAAKKPAPKPAPKPKAVEIVEEPDEPVDSRGRKIGLRGRKAHEGGIVELSALEHETLAGILARVRPGARKMSALERALALEVGEEDVIANVTLQHFATSLGAAKRHDMLEDREFNYTSAAFSPGVGLPAISVLYIKRTA